MVVRCGQLADCIVTALVRPLRAVSMPYRGEDVPLSRPARTGVIFRQQHLRTYYGFSAFGDDRFVLFRREQEQFTILGERETPVDPAKYYELQVEAKGPHIRCRLDGQQVIDVHDDTWPTGRVGFRTNTLMHLARLEVCADAAADKVNIRHEQADREQARRLQSENPAPVLWREAAGPLPGPWNCRFVHLLGPDSWQVLFHGHDQDAEDILAATDLDGRVLWQRMLAELPGPIRQLSCYDIDGDGREEILCVTTTHICLLRPDGGEILRKAPLPPHRPSLPIPWRRTDRPFAPGWAVYWVHFDGMDRPALPVLLGPYSDVCSLDADLKCRWIFHAESGHCFHAADVDGDGREEFGVNHFVLDHRGKVVWEFPGREYLDKDRHADYVAMGNFRGTPSAGVQYAATLGDGGFYLIDMATREILAHRPVGHAQGLSVGNFMPDRPGVEFLVGTRWGNYGIWSLFDAGGAPLGECQPDFWSQGGPPVNWSGRGEELVLVHCAPLAARFTYGPGAPPMQEVPLPCTACYGLYDARGRLAVALPQRHKWHTCLPPQDLTGDGRDALIFHDQKTVYVYQPADPPPPNVYRPRRPTDRRGGTAVSLRL